MYTMTMAT